MPTKLDMVTTDKAYYNASGKPEIVELGSHPYLTLVGQGEPAGEEFTRKVEALYPLAYGVKKYCKDQERDFAVPKLEGLWWVEENRPALEVPRSRWHWKLLIRMPDFVDSEIVDAVQEAVAKKRKNDLILEIAFEHIAEAACVQMMHVGPYATEPATIETLLSYIEENGLSVGGLHHEIYVSDPRKTVPEKMKTIIRYPVK